jgi:hypothetical protein
MCCFRRNGTSCFCFIRSAYPHGFSLAFTIALGSWSLTLPLSFLLVALKSDGHISASYGVCLLPLLLLIVVPMFGSLGIPGRGASERGLKAGILTFFAGLFISVILACAYPDSHTAWCFAPAFGGGAAAYLISIVTVCLHTRSKKERFWLILLITYVSQLLTLQALLLVLKLSAYGGPVAGGDWRWATALAPAYALGMMYFIPACVLACSTARDQAVTPAVLSCVYVVLIAFTSIVTAEITLGCTEQASRLVAVAPMLAMTAFAWLLHALRMVGVVFDATREKLDSVRRERAQAERAQAVRDRLRVVHGAPVAAPGAEEQAPGGDAGYGATAGAASAAERDLYAALTALELTNSAQELLPALARVRALVDAHESLRTEDFQALVIARVSAFKEAKPHAWSPEVAREYGALLRRLSALHAVISRFFSARGLMGLPDAAEGRPEERA